MSKNKNKSKKGVLAAIIALVVAFALVVSGLVVVFLYGAVLKPTEFNYIVPASGEGTGYYRHCYSELNENEQKVYSVILQSIYSQPERIEIPELGDGDLTKVFKALSHDNPDLFNLGLNCSVYTEGLKTYFETDYVISYEDYSVKLQEVKDIASVIIDGASIYTSVYEKEKYVHDYIINHCSYIAPDENAMANTVYGCLVEGKASCEGYSRAFQYVLSALGIENRLVTGESADDGINYINHMWNFVVLDGNGYFVDLTWDDPRSEGNVLRHTYFNVTTDDILIKHRNIAQTLPLCTGTQYNYFVYENAYFDIGSGEAFETKVYNAVYTARQRQYGCVELRFSDKAVMEQAKNTLFNTGIIYNVYNEIGLVSAAGNAKVYYSSDDTMNTICLFF
ncbi:MAG: hypothetical protein IJ025_09645 [Clostridia bacterium]|nr:hypothetical protein [Clostridia bacterium]